MVASMRRLEPTQETGGKKEKVLPPVSRLENGEIIIADKRIGIGGPKPELRNGETLVRVTHSLCPYCQRLLPAIIIEREGKLYIRKVCPTHGEIEDLYYEDAQIYRRFLKYAEEGRGTHVYVPVSAPCPFSCGLCSMHKNHTALANIVATNRCNLSCWYCFFYAEKAGYVYEPSLEQIRMMVRQLAKQGKTMAVQITGGEPLMRDDLVDMVKMLKEEGVRHVQLNTTGIGFAEVFLKNPDLAVSWSRELREAGVNTVYMSFDGVSPKANPKNHWEIPLIFEVFRRSGMTSVVLVPTVIKGINDHELGDIVRFAASNMDIVRAVNFQPISFTGMAKKQEVEKHRITIPEAIKKIEEQTNGEIPRESWYPVPVAGKFAKFVEAVTKKEQFLMGNHVVCGAATYAIIERDGSGRVIKFHPITEYFDVDGFIEYIDNMRLKLEKSGRLMTYMRILKLIADIRKFILKDELPTGKKLSSLLANILLKRNYDALGEMHYNLLFLGMMHFMDQFNYDVQRVMRCNIHYLSPDGRVIPFCAYNVLNDVYRDYVLKKYSVPLEEWKRKHKKHKYGVNDKYVRDLKKLVEHPLYKKTYRDFERDWQEG